MIERKGRVKSTAVSRDDIRADLLVFRIGLVQLEQLLVQLHVVKVLLKHLILAAKLGQLVAKCFIFRAKTVDIVKLGA